MSVKANLEGALAQAIIDRARADERILRLQSALDGIAALEAEQLEQEKAELEAEQSSAANGDNANP